MPAVTERPEERAASGPLDRIVEALGAPRLAKAVEELRVLQRGVASWYGRQFHGRRTASGERFDMYALTAAHPSLPLSSYVRVRNVRNDRSIVVRVNDRGPFHPGRIIDLSFSAARQLDLLGTAAVEIERISEAELRSWRREIAPAVPAAAVPIGRARIVRDRSQETVLASRQFDGRTDAAADGRSVDRLDPAVVARALAQAEGWQQPLAMVR